MKTVRVAAAIILREGKLYATQRAHGALKDGWELPGGKVEENETLEEALKREIREELDMEIEVGELFRTVEYDYPDFHLSMACFLCTLAAGEEPTLKVHKAARWLDKETLESVEWLPADVALVGEIKKKCL